MLYIITTKNCIFNVSALATKTKTRIKIKRRNSYGRLYRSYGNWNPLRIVHFVLYDKARQGVDAQKQYAVANRLKKHAYGTTCIRIFLFVGHSNRHNHLAQYQIGQEVARKPVETIVMTQKEEKEKQKVSRQETGKLFYDLCKATFTVTVLGNLAPLLGLGTTSWTEVIWFLLLGLALTIGLFFIGFKILNR